MHQGYSDNPISSSPLPPAPVLSRPPEAILPTIDWPDLDPLAAEIAALSITSHTITWHLAIGQAFLAISWEQSAAVEHDSAWRTWSYALPKTASDHHERAQHDLTQATLCWSRAHRALTRALTADDQTRQERDPSYALDDREQCRAFTRLINAQRDRIRQLVLQLDRERLTTSIVTGQRPVLRVASSSSRLHTAESEGSDERS